MGNTMRVESVPVNGSTERLFQLKKGNHKRTLSLNLEKRRLESILEEKEGDYRLVTQSQSLPIIETYESLSEKEKEGSPFSNLKFGSSNRAATSSDVWGAFKEWLMTCGGMCRD